MAAATQQRKPSHTTINPHDGRDELNLSEFPICYPAERVPSNIDQLSFEKEEWDPRLKQHVTRRRTITAPPSYGLPAIYDSKVLLGIMALGHSKNGFSSPEVCFSRYELAQVLGLSDDGRTYRRLEKSLKRWAHVSITNENSWRDNNKQTYRDEVFSIFESVEIEGRSGGGKQLDLPLSKIRFSTVFFKSVSSSNIKHLDLAFYCALKTQTAAQAYRVLGKYLWRDSGRMEMDLKQFGIQHIGLSPKYKPTDLKRKLKPGIEELEQSGVIEAATVDQRYKKGKRRGEWKVCFARGEHFDKPKLPQPAESAPKKESDDPLVGILVERGMTKSVAKRFVAKAKGAHEDIQEGDLTRDYITKVIEYLDWEIDRGKEPDDHGAWLKAAIQQGDYQTPKGFMTKAEREEKARQVEAKEKAKLLKQQQKEEQQRLERQRQNDIEEKQLQRVQSYLDSLADSDREQLIDDAILKSGSFIARYAREYRANPESDTVGEVYYRRALIDHVLPMLPENEAA